MLENRQSSHVQGSAAQIGRGGGNRIHAAPHGPPGRGLTLWEAPFPQRPRLEAPGEVRARPACAEGSPLRHGWPLPCSNVLKRRGRRLRERERDRASPPASRPKARWSCEPRASPSRPSLPSTTPVSKQPRRGSGLRYEFVRWGRGGQKTRSVRAALQWSGLNAAAQPTPTWRPTTTGPSCRTRPEVLTIQSATF